MARVRPFRGLRPPKELVEKVESRPYDVLDSEEARYEAGDNEMSLYHIIRPEIDFPEGTDEYAPCIYEKAAANFIKFQEKGWLVQDDKPMYYIYAQTMNNHTQYGLVIGAAVQDYLSGAIKKHELTRHDKEEDRMKHVRATDANMEPVFLAYPDNEILSAIVKKHISETPEYDFIAPVDGFRHQFWLIRDDVDIQTITETFETIPSLYIADGHHRSAAAALVGEEKATAHGHADPEAEYNYFMAVCFPMSELTILDYNRVIKETSHYSTREFLDLLSEDFEVTCMGYEPYKPQKVHEFSIYVEENWYRLQLRPGRYNEADPIEALDVSICSRLILDKLLGITDLRKDKRIDFVGGLRGLGELKRRCDSGEMKLAIALYPVTMQQIMEIADNGKIMPPKATWFEPKLRSGLVIHKLS